jgi:hypothetical protein
MVAFVWIAFTSEPAYGSEIARANRLSPRMHGLAKFSTRYSEPYLIMGTTPIDLITSKQHEFFSSHIDEQ